MNKVTVILILIIILTPFGYFAYTLSENEYKSPKNIDKYVTIESIQYIPNGRSTALCQMVCRDSKGFEYHITDSDRHFVGDKYQYSERHGRFYIYVQTIFILIALISIIIGIIFMLLLIFNIL